MHHIEEVLIPRQRQVSETTLVNVNVKFDKFSLETKYERRVMLWLCLRCSSQLVRWEQIKPINRNIVQSCVHTSCYTKPAGELHSLHLQQYFHRYQIIIHSISEKTESKNLINLLTVKLHLRTKSTSISLELHFSPTGNCNCTCRSMTMWKCMDWWSLKSKNNNDNLFLE